MREKTQFFLCQQKLEDEDFGINLMRLKSEIVSFYDIITFMRNIPLNNLNKAIDRVIKNVKSLIVARSHFDNTIALLIGTMQLESNPYIQQVNTTYQAYQAFLSHLGIANARLDILFADLERVDRISSNLSGKFTGYDLLNAIEMTKQTLKHFMDVFIVFSLSNAYTRYKKITVIKTASKDGKITEKKVTADRDWFGYLLFLELYDKAKIEGGIARQSIMKNVSTSSIKAIENISATKSPPMIPDGVRSEELDKEKQDLQQAFFQLNLDDNSEGEENV